VTPMRDLIAGALGTNPVRVVAGEAEPQEVQNLLEVMGMGREGLRAAAEDGISRTESRFRGKNWRCGK